VSSSLRPGFRRESTPRIVGYLLVIYWHLWIRASSLLLNLIFTIRPLSFKDLPMLVCHCHALTDRDIRRSVRLNDACSVAEVGDHCGAANGCGGCYELVAEIVACEKRRLAMFNPADAQDAGISELELDLALTG